MIEIQKIKQYDDLSFIINSSFDVFYYGEAIDDRTKYILNNINLEPKYTLKFNKDDYCLYINQTPYSLQQLDTFKQFSSCKKVLIDSTSLDFPELLYLLYSLKCNMDHFDVTILYIEPQNYNYKKGLTLIVDEEFTLSENKSTFSTLPLFSINSIHNNKDKTVLLAFLGFENSRLGQILKSDDGNIYRKLLAYIGVPAYQAGWENISLNKHLDYFGLYKTELKLYPSNNPYQIVKDLDKTYKFYPNLVIASLGTKPATIASIIFLINNIKGNKKDHQVGTIYDYPVKSSGRSQGIGSIFAYSLSKYN